MATTTFKSLISILFFATLAIKGSCTNNSCSLNNINIGTTRTGREIQGKPEWHVSVINNCACPQSRIMLHCEGFQTVERVDPAVLSKQGDECLFINGNTLHAFTTVEFSYAWDPPFLLMPSSSLLGPC